MHKQPYWGNEHGALPTPHMPSANNSVAENQSDHYSHGQSQITPSPQGAGQQRPSRDFGNKFVAYGGKAAFQVGEATTKDGRYTVNIESAHKLNPSNMNDRKLDWSAKTTFQLTINELPVFIAVMYGFIPSARFDSHGACNTKFLDVINQTDKFFFKSGSQDAQMKVAPVSIADATHFGMLALSSYSKNFPNLTSDSVMTGLKILVKRMMDANQIKLPKQR